MYSILRRRNLLAFFVVIIIPIGFYTFFEIKKHSTGIRYKQLPVMSKTAIPQFSFTGHNGVSVSRSTFDNKILIANFFFTKCRGICPKMTGQMLRVQEYISGHPNLKSEYQILSFSVDPENDSIAVLNEYANVNGVDSTLWLLVTGEKDSIYNLAINFFKLPAGQIMRDTLEPFVHSERFVMLDKEGYIRGYYDGTDPDNVLEMMKDIVYLDIDYEISKKKRKK